MENHTPAAMHETAALEIACNVTSFSYFMLPSCTYFGTTDCQVLGHITGSPIGDRFAVIMALLMTFSQCRIYLKTPVIIKFAISTAIIIFLLKAT
jgi:hypothetical protein